MTEPTVQNAKHIFYAGPEGASDADNDARDIGVGSHYLLWDHLLARRLALSAREAGSNGYNIDRRKITSIVGGALHFDKINDQKVGGGRLTRETFSELCRLVDEAGTFSTEMTTDFDQILHEFADSVAALPTAKIQMASTSWEHTSAQIGEGEAEAKLGDECKWVAYLTIGMFDEHGEPGRALAQYIGTTAFFTTEDEMLQPQNLAVLTAIYNEAKQADHRIEDLEPVEQARCIAHFFFSSACQRLVWTPPHDRDSARREITRRSAPTIDALKERLTLTRLRTFPNLRSLLPHNCSGSQLRDFALRIVAARSPSTPLSMELFAATEADAGKLISQIPAATLADSNSAVCSWVEVAIRTLQSGISAQTSGTDGTTRGPNSTTEVVDLDAFVRRHPELCTAMASLHTEGAEPQKLAKQLLKYQAGCILIVTKKTVNMEGFKSL